MRSGRNLFLSGDLFSNHSMARSHISVAAPSYPCEPRRHLPHTELSPSLAPAWSPDGTKIAFQSTLYDPGGGRLCPVGGRLRDEPRRHGATQPDRELHVLRRRPYMVAVQIGASTERRACRSAQ
ncbi:MAG TPA: hypothetical protein EYQ64_00035, partial [Gemmatimonadetes bacterium]|nr:hypothetical protein [Gemmatimonadota bacterium]